MAHDTPAANLERDDALRNTLHQHHGAFHQQLPSLERAAWDAARGVSSRQTLDMMKALNAFRDELMRHCKLGQALVYPFAGQPRAAGIIDAHLSDQRLIERAFQAAQLAAHGALKDEMKRLAPRVRAFFDDERRFITAPPSRH